MSGLIDLKLRGPHTLAVGIAAGDSLFAAAEAWQPGIYLWAFQFNQSERITYAGSADASVAQAHAAHLAAFLRGEYPLHDPDSRAAGRLERVYQAGDGASALAESRAALLAELAALRIFFAPLAGDSALRARVVAAIAEHLRKLGGKALAWFDGGVARPAAPLAGEAPLTVRFYRPVHMASMPEELSI